ncbi:MAG: hypothetical protein FJ403_04215 [Verrucomicrobia bacterium]|nr:hypothetical protein [Verrucomicrobiota bacterium]
MKTFTVRDLDRQPAVVLDACDREGSVRVRRRDGRSYTVRRDDGESRAAPAEKRQHWLNKHKAWLARTFPKPIGAKQTALVDRRIAGE